MARQPPAGVVYDPCNSRESATDAGNFGALYVLHLASEHFGFAPARDSWPLVVQLALAIFLGSAGLVVGLAWLSRAGFARPDAARQGSPTDDARAA